MHSLVFNALIVSAAVAFAMWLRLWRLVGAHGPPWPWVLARATMPLMWGLDRYLGVPVIQPMSGAVLLVLMAGWPLAILALLPVAIATAVIGDLGWVQALDRLICLGVVPATLALAIGAAVRRWLPNHLLVYLFARSFIGTLIVLMVSNSAALAQGDRPFAGADLIARLLISFAEAFLTGVLTSSFVFFSPRLLATSSDRLYLPSGVQLQQEQLSTPTPQSAHLPRNTEAV